MDNTITLLLGGEERTLDFGKNKILKCLNQVTKDTGFNLLEEAVWKDPGKSYQSILFFIRAGLMASGFDFPADKVEEWVDEISLDRLNDIKFAGFAAITQRPVDEFRKIAAVEEDIRKKAIAQVKEMVHQNGMEKVL